MEGNTTVHFVIDNGLTPMSLAKSIIDSGVFDKWELDELAKYLEVYVRYHREVETE